MRINETYEHETILPQKPEESGHPHACNKIVTQCVDVTAPVILQPTASLGTVTVSCQGAPTVTCAADASGTCCTVTLTQQVCVTMPVRYGVTMNSGEPVISCADCGAAPPCGCKG